MNLTNRIRVALITFAIFATILSLVSLATYFVKSENEAVKCLQEQNELKLKHLVTFSHFCDADTHPRFLLTVSALNLIYFICLLITRKSIYHTLALVSVLLLFPYWYWWTQRAIAYTESVNLKGLDLYLYRATRIDLMVFGLLFIAGVMQVFVSMRRFDSRLRLGRLS
jgi:hypothetical protein